MPTRRTEPYWSRVVVGLCCLCGVWLGIDASLGGAVTVPPLGFLLAVAAAVTAATGPDRFKVAAVGLLAAVFLVVAIVAVIA
jgi:hypothetical protein